MVLITDSKDVDPTNNWLGQLVYEAYEVTKKLEYFYMTPIIAP